MGTSEWYNYNNSSNPGKQTIVLGQGYTKQSSYDARWRSFWRKIKIMEIYKKNKDKKTYKLSSSSVRLQSSPYDPSTYSKNFDQGKGGEEPDNLSRSFSARFADPSRIFPKTIVLLD